ncbi:MAG TPA: PilN domain-containing protein [Stellaceae bacterium]
MGERGARILALLQGLFRWWIGELAALVPERLRRRLASTTDTLVLLLGEGDATLCLETRQELKTLGRIELRSESEPNHRLAAILRQHELPRQTSAGKAAICLRLRSERALRTTVDLPLVAEGNLEEVVSFELDRHTPFKAEQAVFSHRILERDAAQQRLRVELFVVPRLIIADAIAVADRLHFDADRIDIAEASGSLAASGNLLPSRAHTHRRSYERTLIYALGSAAALLALVALYLPVYGMQQRAAALEQEFDAAKKAAAAAAALQKEIDALRKDELFLVDRKRDRTTVSTLLLETTRLLPDDTWLSEWQLAGSEIQLTGYAGSASALIKLLEQSRAFRNSTFQSPVVQDTKTGRERFHIAAQVAEAGAP